MNIYGGKGPLSFSIDWYRRRIVVFDGGGGGGCPLGVGVRNRRAQNIRVARGIRRVRGAVGGDDGLPVDLGLLGLHRRGLRGQDGRHGLLLGGGRPLDGGAGGGGGPLSRVFG